MTHEDAAVGTVGEEGRNADRGRSTTVLRSLHPMDSSFVAAQVLGPGGVADRPPGRDRRTTSKTREQDSDRSVPRLRSWAAMVSLVVLVGVVGSVVGARVEARNDSLRSREASFATSTAIASKLELAMQHEQDLVVTAAAFIAGNPEATQADSGGR